MNIEINKTHVLIGIGLLIFAGLMGFSYGYYWHKSSVQNAAFKQQLDSYSNLINATPADPHQIRPIATPTPKPGTVLTIKPSINISLTSSTPRPNNDYPSYGSSDKTVQVRGYYRKDGTYVRPHTRSRPRR